MPRDLRTYLWHIEEAGDNILSYLQDKSFVDYARDGMMRAAVERKFEIIGEALVRISTHFPETIEQIPRYRSFIGFRNVLIHQYDDLKEANVWDAAQNSLPALLVEIRALKKRLDLIDPLS